MTETRVECRALSALRFWGVALLCGALTWGCGGEQDHDHDGDDHEHEDEGPDEDGDDHDDDDDDHGEKHDLGTMTVGAVEVNLAIYGDVAAGGEIAVDAVMPDGTTGTVRAWVGSEAGLESVKAKLEDEGEGLFHGHVEVPDPLPAGSMVWIEHDAGGDVKAAAGAAYE